MGADHDTPEPAAVSRAVDEGLAAPGRPLGADVRQAMEQRFGQDLGRVRVHDGPAAARSARDLGARAYAVGRHVVLGDDAAGPDLLAHELTHVIQQREHWDAPVRPTRLSRPDAPAEREAAVAPRTVSTRTSPAVVHRQQRPDAGAPDAGARDAGAPDAGAPQPAAAFPAALAGVQRLDPVLHAMLSRPALGGPAVPVRSGTTTDPTTTPPTTLTFAFNLRIVQGAVPAGATAHFDSGQASLSPAGPQRSLTANMTITVTAAVTTADLYHEAVHMVLFMDRLVSSSQTAGYSTGFASYQRLARASRSWSQLAAELEVHIELDLTLRNLNQPGLAAREAQAILANCLEEKFVFDQERAKVGTQRPNAAIAAGYLQQGFGTVGVHQPRPPDFQRMVGLLTAVFDDVDRGVAPQPAPAPAPAPRP